jgi:hypothetical protein
MWRDRIRAYKVVVDGEVVASIGAGETQTVAIAPGRHRVWAKIDWCRSRAHEIDVAEGSRATFTLRPNGPLLLAIVYATILAPRYLDLRQDAPA